MRTQSGFLICTSIVVALLVGCVASSRPALTGQALSEEQRELVGKKLHWQLFEMPADREGIDHLHCSFCDAQMSSVPARRGETDGYTTDDRHLWVCNRCFDRLNPGFHWAEK